jgi:hypothetical protein
MNTQNTPTRRQARTAWSATGAPSTPRSALAKAVVVSAACSAAANAVIAALARGPLGVSSAFRPLTPPVFLMFTVIGAAVGAFGWRMITRRSQRPARLLRRLVPAVLVLSFIPDLLVLATKAMPGTSTTAVLTLMAMHIAVAAIAVLSYQRFLPARD